MAVAIVTTLQPVKHRWPCLGAEARVFSKRLSIGWADFLYWPCFLSSRFADCSLPLPSPSSASIRRQYLVNRGRSIVYRRQSLSSFCSRMLNDIAVNLWTRCDASINSNNDTKTVSINHIYRHFRVNFPLNLAYTSVGFTQTSQELTTLSIAPMLDDSPI